MVHHNEYEFLRITEHQAVFIFHWTSLLVDISDTETETDLFCCSLICFLVVLTTRYSTQIIVTSCLLPLVFYAAQWRKDNVIIISGVISSVVESIRLCSDGSGGGSKSSLSPVGAP